MASPSPVLVLIKAEKCSACEHLTKVWNECLRQMKEIVPNLIEVTIVKPTLMSPINTNNYPAILNNFHWFPNVMLVPGKSWQEAMAQVGTGNVTPLPGAQIFNASWVTSVTAEQHLRANTKYNLFNPQDCRNWILQAINSEEFRRANTPSINTLPLLSAPPRKPFSAVNPADINYRSSVCKPGYVLVPKIGAHSR